LSSGRDQGCIIFVSKDLANLLDNIRVRYTLSEIKCLFRQVLEGVEYLHKSDIIHRDLKISNLLLNSRGILKIADFGMAREIDNKPMTPQVVTVWYRAPELLFGAREYTKAIDIWSVGLILGELLLHTPVLPGENESEEVQLIIALLGTPPSENLWPRFRNMPLRDEYRLPLANEALENGKMTLKMRFREYSDATRGLMRRCLEWDPEERCSAKGALQHAYFKEEPRAQDPALLPTFPEGRNMSENQSTQKRGFVFDAEELVGAHGGLAKKYRKG